MLSTRSARRFVTTLLVGLAATALLAVGCGDDDSAAGSDDAGLTSEVQEEFGKLVEGSLGVPGGVVAVFVGGEQWVEVVGDAAVPTTNDDGATEPAQAEPVTADMVWPLRSITKSFTVTLLLQLVDEGLVSLDDTIDQYVDGVPNGSEATLAQLADMSSGVPEYTTQAWVDDFMADPERAFTGPELIAYANAEPAQFAAGAQHVYTNTNTVLLGQVIEEVTGESFATVLGDRILEPLGLDTTVYPSGIADWNGPHAIGYQMDDGSLAAQPVNFSVFDTAGAMISNVGDLRTWGTALATGSLISAESQEARVAAAVPLDEGPEYDAYGMGIGEIDGWWGHTGEGMGFEALVMHDEDLDATVVIYVNMSNIVDESTGEPVHVPTKLFREIVAILDSAGSGGS